jgi:hypothetical protein
MSLPPLHSSNRARSAVVAALFVVALSADPSNAQPHASPDDDAAPPPAADEQNRGGVLIFGERLLHYKRDEDGNGSGRFEPPLPLEDKAMLLAAMKSLTRAVYGIHGIDVEDMDAFDPRIGRVTSLEDFDFDYRFMLDGSIADGVRVILVQRREAERTIDEELLLQELEAL